MFGKKNKVPEWANQLKEKEFLAFMAAVQDYFSTADRPFTIDDGMVRFLDDDSSLGLANPMQICAQNDIADYPEIISYHFDLMREADAFRAKFAELEADFEAVKSYLGVRLYPQEYISFAGENSLICRHFTGELFSVLVWDFPTAIETVQASQVEKWNVSEAELFAIGAENVNNNYAFEIATIAATDDVDLYVIETEHFFAANILLDLDAHPELVKEGGAIVAVPLRNLALIYPISDINVARALTPIFAHTTNMYAAGPGALTQEVYWYHDGQFESLNYTATGK
ncbi:MAG: hypothetical protein FWG47_02155 [Propionibacteriaceae bacterium]|nr:hypothetical protein [Propionibacteriaceae bacterium]